MTFHWNDDTIEVVHVAPAHTDGDSFVHLRSANAIHAGDVFFNGMLRAGKSRDEVIAAKPTADLDADWGGGFMKPDVWIGIVYDGYQRAHR